MAEKNEWLKVLYERTLKTRSEEEQKIIISFVADLSIGVMAFIVSATEIMKSIKSK